MKNSSRNKKVKKIAIRFPLLWAIGIFLLIYGAISFFTGSSGSESVPTSQMIATLNSGEKLKSATIIDGEQTIKIEYPDGKKQHSTWVGEQSTDFVKALEKRSAAKTIEEWRGETSNGSFLTLLIGNLLPIILIAAFFFFSFRMLTSQRMGFGASKAKVFNEDRPSTTFQDVAGCEEAIEELQEIREFLAEPKKFTSLGAKIPKGVLLYGPPGTGKTLLAKAVAGEAKVPFFSISGSEFVEMFAGLGASRVRDLFNKAKSAAPAIIFVDEIDAVGRQRGSGMGASHDEREQTLNQLLVEMDGFDSDTGVVLIAATNRPDVLDPALLRPGRFDRQVPVEAPDLDGRLKILLVHAKNKPFAREVDLEAIARRTPGMTGADLANVLNEAALLTARANLRQIGPRELDEAIDRVIAGPQKRTRVMDEHERLVTAYHEGGHALVAAAMPGNDPVQKITILPRGKALGYTMVMPDQDKYSQTRGELLGRLAYMLGGRAAEELVFHDPTTGAANDIEKATKTARAMVMQYGMTERLGTVRYGHGDTEPFMGRDLGRAPEFSESTAAVIDEEVAKLIHTAHQEAFEVLEENRDILDELVRQLFAKETLNKEEVAKIFEPLRRRPNRGPWTGSDNRKPSDIPPITPPVKENPEPSKAQLYPAPGSSFPVAVPEANLPNGVSYPGNPNYPSFAPDSEPKRLASEPPTVTPQAPKDPQDYPKPGES